jgi:hypothetical protein
LELGNGEANGVLDTVKLEAQALDSGGGAVDDLGSFSGSAVGLSNAQVRIHGAINEELVVADEEQVVDVDTVAEPIDNEVVGLSDAISRAEVGASVQNVFMRGLCHKDAMRPTHGQGGAAGVHQSVGAVLITKANVTSSYGRQSEPGLEPLGDPNAVIEVVQIHFADEEGTRVEGLKSGKEIRPHQVDMRRRDHLGVGRTQIRDETL